jgi:hypothetical protein
MVIEHSIQIYSPLEEPAKLAEDIRAWFRQFREDPVTQPTPRVDALTAGSTG